MTEEWLHEFFHAILPTLAAHVDYVLAAVGVWFARRVLQVKNTEIATLLVEIEAMREERLGRRVDGEVKNLRARKRADELDGVFVRPSRKRRAKLIESVRPGASKSKA